MIDINSFLLGLILAFVAAIFVLLVLRQNKYEQNKIQDCVRKVELTTYLNILNAVYYKGNRGELKVTLSDEETEKFKKILKEAFQDDRQFKTPEIRPSDIGRDLNLGDGLEPTAK